jgi:hypothetical protein
MKLLTIFIPISFIEYFIPAVQIFPEADEFNNDLPGWHQ